MIKHGISYHIPKVVLLHASPLWIGECAARTAYNSFDKSEHIGIQLFPIDKGRYFIHNPDIASSEILTSLAWVHHHHSVLELMDLSFSIQSTSRAVLVEHSRHRIQSLTVQSTRYTMSDVINAYIASLANVRPKEWFLTKMIELDILVTKDDTYNAIEYATIWDKLLDQQIRLSTDEFRKTAIAKSSLQYLENPFNADTLFEQLQDGKKKRNVGDAFKHIVTDNWKVDMIVKFNLRSLKNYLTLRASGAAYFQINMLAEEMIKVIPNKYLDLIRKRK